MIYAWGLRSREASMLDTVDFTANPSAPELGHFGMLAVRYGKAMRGPVTLDEVAPAVRRWDVPGEDFLTRAVRPT